MAFKLDILNSRLFVRTLFLQVYSRWRTFFKFGRIKAIYVSEPKSKSEDFNWVKMINTERHLTKVLFGPWMGELGFEILYWAPLVNYLSKKGDISLSRGGISILYPGLQYLDIFDRLDNTAWIRAQNDRKRILGGEKQRKWTFKELKLTNYFISTITTKDIKILHPNNLFELYGFSSGKERNFQEKLLKDYVNVFDKEFKKLALNSKRANKSCLIATYTREGLSSEQLNNFFKTEKFKKLVSNKEMCFLSNTFGDNSHEFVVPNQKVEDKIVYRNNLEHKIQQMLTCKMIITTDGGLAYLSVLLGKDTYAIRGSGDYWSEHHYQLAKYMSKLKRCKYVIVNI